MNLPERARIITEILNVEYPDKASLLHYRNPYELLIAVILSAQTTDAGVNKVTPGLFAKYPAPAELARAVQGEVEDIIHSTGFFRVKAPILLKQPGLLSAGLRVKFPGAWKNLSPCPGWGVKQPMSS